MARKILIVDDTPDAIAFLPQWLQLAGYEPLVAATEQQVYAAAAEVRPDLILLDMTIAGVDGLDLCRRLTRDPATADIPVILLSPRSAAEAEAEASQGGAASSLTKPLDHRELQDQIKRVIWGGEPDNDDPRQLLEGMAFTALAVVPCQLAWLLTVDLDHCWLVSEAIAMERGVEAAQQFLLMAQGVQDELHFKLQADANPLADIVLARKVLINVPVMRFHDLPGGAALRDVFAHFRLKYVTLLPLVTAGQSVGAMVLATTHEPLPETRQAQQILRSLNSQAAMIVDNARLVTDLAYSDAQMRTEQAFRQMVLDTMGEGLVVVDDEAHITYVNNRLLLLTGYRREDLYGASVGLIFHPDSRARIVRALTDEHRSTLPFSQQLYTHNGQSVPVLLSRAIAFDPSEGRRTVMVVTDLSELQRNEEALSLQTKRLQVINRASTAIASARSLDDVVLTSLQSALEVVGGRSATLFLRDIMQPTELKAIGAVGPDPQYPVGTIVPLDDDLIGLVAQMQEPQLIIDAPHHAAASEEVGAVEPAQSLLLVPLITSERLVGVLQVVEKLDGRFDNQDLETLESLSGSVATAIEKQRLLEEAQRRLTELSTLLDASAAVSFNLDFEQILERITRRLSVAMKVERVLIGDWHKSANELDTVIEVVNAYWPPHEAPLRPIDSLPLTCSVMESGVMMLADDTRLDDTPAVVQELNPSGLLTVAGFPVVIGDDVVGVVTLHAERSDHGFTPDNAATIEDLIIEWQAEVEADNPAEWTALENVTNLCHRIQYTVDVRWCSVLKWDRNPDKIRLLCEMGRAIWLSKGHNSWDVTQYHALQQVLDTSRAATLHIDNLDDDPQEAAYLRQVGGRSCLLTPLVVRGAPGGVVRMVDCGPETRVFDREEQSLAQGIAHVIGQAMENAQLYAAQEQRASALEAAYNELHEADQLKEELLQNLSHELRTPLTHILGYLQLTLDDTFGSLTDEQRETLQLVTNKAQHLTDLVQDITAVQEAASHQLDFNVTQLERVVSLAVRTMTPKADAEGIRLLTDIPAQLPPVYADSERIREVFEELVENAIKFSPRARSIEIVLADNGGPMLNALVRDEGIGIPADEHEKVFRRFYQVDGSTARRFGGNGLGLAIVRQVVEAHNGRVWVESEPDKGSSFHLTLPKATTVMHP